MGVVNAETPAGTVEAEINYLAANSLINRRFLAPGVVHNTGIFEPRQVKMRDGRGDADRFTLDTHGFVLAQRPSKVADFLDNTQVEAVYPDEVVETVKALTGASRVAVMGWMFRSSGDLAKRQQYGASQMHRGGVQPPAADVHVDLTSDRADRWAKMAYERTFPDGPGYSRYIASSLWRTFSEPPQDWPLALCDGGSVGDDEGTPNTMFVLDALPSEAAMLGEMPNEDAALAASVFRYNPNHRWWYFSNMTRDEVVLIKLHDSDHTRIWRAPHTAFHNAGVSNARVRESIEVRSIAYFD
jgi:hypothetical protein